MNIFSISSWKVTLFFSLFYTFLFFYCVHCMAQLLIWFGWNFIWLKILVRGPVTANRILKFDLEVGYQYWTGLMVFWKKPKTSVFFLKTQKKTFFFWFLWGFIGFCWFLLFSGGLTFNTGFWLLIQAFQRKNLLSV